MVTYYVTIFKVVLILHNYRFLLIENKDLFTFHFSILSRKCNPKLQHTEFH